MNQTKSTSKKLLALLLALIMTVSLLPMSVFAAELEQTDADGQPVVEQGVDDAVTDGEDTEDVEPADGEGDVTLPEEPAEDAEPEEDVTLPGDEETPDEALLAAENGIAVQAITIAEKPIFSGTTEQPFVKNIGAGNSFRIPAMVTLNDGTIVAAADARWQNAHDGGGNDTIVAYFTNGGTGWNHTFANYMGDNNYTWTRDSTTFIDPALATDGTNVYMLVDLFVHGRSNAPGRDAELMHEDGCGIVKGNKLQLAMGDSGKYNYYLNLTDSKIYDSNDNEVSGYTVDKYFNITSTDGSSVKTNLFFTDSPYQVYPTIYTYLTKSSDGGKTWSEPTLFDLGNDNEYGCLVGPGRGIVATDGTIIFPFYNFPSDGGSLQLGFLYSTDKGVTWKRSDSGVSGSTEGTIVELSDGTLRVFYRTTSDNKRGIHYMDVTGNGENGYTWRKNDTPAVVSGANSYSDCQLSAIKYSKTVKVNGENHEAIIVSCPTGSSRVDGRLYLLDAETMTVLGQKDVNTGNYQYSCLTELQNGNIGLLYETHADSAYVDGTIQYATYDPSVIFSKVTFNESTVTPDKPDTGETDPSTPDTPATGETIVIKVGKGQTVKKSYTFDANVTVKDGSYKDDYCDVTWEANKVAGGTTVNKVETPAAGEYYISDGTNYLKLTSSNSGYYGTTYNVETTADRADATKFTFAASGSGYTISAKMGTATVYLYGYNGSLYAYDSYSFTWTWDANGIYYTQTSYAWGGGTTTYYLAYNSGWTLSSSSSTTKGYAYKEVTKEPVNEAKLTVTGKVAGPSKEEFQIGNKMFRVEVVDGYFAEVAVGGTETISLSEANVTLQEGQTVVWTVGDDGKYAGIYSQDGTNATLTGREKTPDSTTTIATATVKKADGTVAATYNWLVTVTEGTKPNAGDYEVTYTITNTVYNGKLYYSVSGSPLKEVPYTETIKADGSIERTYTISETETGVKYSQIELFVAPDEGYAVSKIAASTTAQGTQFYALDKSGYKAIYDEDNHKGGKLESVLTEGQIKAMIKEAADAGCDAVLWYSRGDNGNKDYHTDPKGPLTKDDSVTATLYYYCDKLPTVDKKISHLISNGAEVLYDANGMIADVDDQVVFEITITGYSETAAIDYSKVSLKDTMAGVTLYSDRTCENELGTPNPDGSVTYSGDALDAQLNADRTNGEKDTYTYYAAYTLTDDDLKQGRKLENTVELSYTYQSTYSTGAYGGASEADAAFQLTDFPQINDIVVDFGLPVTVLNGVKWAENYHQTIYVTAATANYGEVDYYGDNKKDGLTVIYTPTTMTREIDTVTLTSSRGNTSTFRVIPASTVYYEDSFASFYNNAGTEQKSFQRSGDTDTPGTWYVDGTEKNVNQALEALGGKKNVYGYDPAYDNCTMFSMGSAKKVTVSKEDTSCPTAQFTFKGTGFDVISLTDNNSGAIIVNVTAKDEANEGYNKNFLVNNYYGYTYVDGTGWEATPNDKNNALYQIPVMKVTDLPYGEYAVTITVTYGEFFDKTGDSQYSFWLDAIRVYDPMGKNYDYTDDQEGYPQYIKLRDELAKDNSTVNHTVLFIDGKEDADIQDYTNYGPNNEVYLLKDQNIAFKLNIPAGVTVASVQIGAKAPMGTGKSAVMKVNGQQVGPKNGDETGNIASATEMYYDITTQAKSGQQVTITNFGGEGILSLTNLKITFTSNPGDTEVALGTLTDTEQANAVQMVRAMYAPAPEPDPEPVVFAPERFEASWSRSTVKVGQKATLTVKTSEDVEAITVDGVTIDTYRTRTQRTGWGWNAKRVTYREFTYTITANEAGTLNYSVAALNAENVASEPITAALTVQAAAQRPSWGGWLGNLFGRWF